MIMPRQYTMAVIEDVARKHGVTVALIIGRSKPQDGGVLRQARAETVARLRAERGLSTTAIGQIMGGRDHTTICHYMYQGAMERQIEKVRRYKAAS